MPKQSVLCDSTSADHSPSRSSLANVVAVQRSQLRYWRSNGGQALALALTPMLGLWLLAHVGAPAPSETTALLFVAGWAMLALLIVHIVIRYVAGLKNLRGSLAILYNIRDRQCFGATADVTTLLSVLSDVLAPADLLGDSSVRTVLARVVRDGHAVTRTGAVELPLERARACLQTISRDPALGSALQGAGAMLLIRLEAGMTGDWLGGSASSERRVWRRRPSKSHSSVS